MSYCTRFDGSYTDGEGQQQQVEVGPHYRLKVLMFGPVSLADMARQVSTRVDEVSHLDEFSAGYQPCLYLHQRNITLMYINVGFKHGMLLSCCKVVQQPPCS